MSLFQLMLVISLLFEDMSVDVQKLNVRFSYRSKGTSMKIFRFTLALLCA